MAKRILLTTAVILQIACLLLSPRFGWYMHYTDGTIASYSSTSYKDGRTILHYDSDNIDLDIAYKNRFSRELEVSFDGGKPQRVVTRIDGKSIEELSGTTNFTINDIVWMDSSGIFFYRYIVAFLGTLLSILIFTKSASKSRGRGIAFKTFAALIYFVTLLSSLRIFPI